MAASKIELPSMSADSITTSLLPAGYFYEAEHYAREQKLLFERSWMNVGHASLIPNSGDYMIREVGAQEIIVVRGDDGDVNAFYNVCRPFHQDCGAAAHGDEPSNSRRLSKGVRTRLLR